MKKLALVALVIIVAIFSHYYNKHVILHSSRQLDKMNTEIYSLKEINLELLNQNFDLKAHSRIVHLAKTRLEMIPIQKENTTIVSIDNATKKYYLIDYFIPSAEAITSRYH
jgi:cell division protein FtsL